MSRMFLDSIGGGVVKDLKQLGEFPYPLSFFSKSHNIKFQERAPNRHLLIYIIGFREWASYKDVWRNRI